VGTKLVRMVQEALEGGGGDVPDKRTKPAAKNPYAPVQVCLLQAGASALVRKAAVTVVRAGT